MGNYTSTVCPRSLEPFYMLYVQEVVTQPKILNRTILYNLVHVTHGNLIKYHAGVSLLPGHTVVYNTYLRLAVV